MAPSRVFLVDDHPVFRHGLRQLIEQDGSLEVIGEADSLRPALDAIQADPPDIALVDISLKGVGGLELIKALKVHMPQLPTLVLSMHDEDLYAERAIRAGASGYLQKHEAAERIVPSIRKALAGELVLSPRLSDALLRRALQGKSADVPTSPLDVLSDRELEVYEHVGHGLGTRDIATTLHISVKTVETHKANIKHKLELKGATDLLRSAVAWVGQLET